MTVNVMTLLAIIGMALATYATRVGGLFLIRYIDANGRMKAALDAMPPAILMAVIAPTILTTGPAETSAAIITAIAAFLRLPLVVTLIIGVASVVLLRYAIG